MKIFIDSHNKYILYSLAAAARLLMSVLSVEPVVAVLFPVTDYD